MIEAVKAAMRRLPKARFVASVTPIEPQLRLGKCLGVDLLVKRDDLTGSAFGGNKVRQLEYYMGAAQSADADVVLITGAVQSNFVRTAAACAARCGMDCHIQLEERVSDVDAIYRNSGNVLLSEMLGAFLHWYPAGEDEAGADANLDLLAEALRLAGRRPYVIHLGAMHAPLGALGYIDCAGELLDQCEQPGLIVLGSGSGQTHAGLLFGLRAQGWMGRVLGICVRRNGEAQKSRVFDICRRLASLLEVECPVAPADVEVWDGALAPGYGTMNKTVAEAIELCARLEGLILEPVYTGRVMVGLISFVRDRAIEPGARVTMLHSGGLPAVFGYESELRRWIISPSRVRRSSN